ncbi:MAG: octaprenyl diphosphate synthase [Acidiferrobacterales bacterium]
MSELQEKAAKPDIDLIRNLAGEEMAAVDREIERQLDSDVVLIRQLGAYLIHSGGKRLRPLLLLLAAKGFGYQGDKHVKLAAIIEFIHTATLLHDDVVDASELRRGQSTANAVFGNEASVLVGDFLYSRAFEMMVEVDQMPVMDVLAGTTNTIAEGEVLQLLNCNDPDTSEERYLTVIRNKTAKLFEAATRLAAMISGQDEAMQQHLANYGMHLGIAFQLIDDALDYSADAETLGKNIGDDLAEGKPTLPLIHCMKTGTPAQSELIRNAIISGAADQIEQVRSAIESTDSITYTARRAEEQARLAMQSAENMPDSPYKQALLDLALYSVHRTF